LRSISLPCHLRLGFPRGLFPSGFSTKIVYASLMPPLLSTHPTHLILLDLITLSRLVKGGNYEAPHYAFFPA
jgi:hypothetical protein